MKNFSLDNSTYLEKASFCIFKKCNYSTSLGFVATTCSIRWEDSFGLISVGIGSSRLVHVCLNLNRSKLDPSSIHLYN